MSFLRPYLKFLVKMRIVTPLRSLFLFVMGVLPERKDWEARMLIVNLEALGDLVVFTSVLKHYKKNFPGKKIYLLIKDVGLKEIFAGAFADEVITLDYKKFAVNPFYGTRLINRLRKIGFATVINHDFSAAEIMGKIISVEVGADEVVGYEGLGVEFARPFDVQQVKNMRIVLERLYPRFTKLIPSIDAMRGMVKKMPSAVRHYIQIYEHATGRKEAEYATAFPAGTLRGVPATLARCGLEAKNYVVLNVNASVPYKRWPLPRFAEVARLILKKGLRLVLVGSQEEVRFVEEFIKISGIDALNLAGRTDLAELIHIVSAARLVVTNDTSLVHFAVALRTPSLCVTGGGQFGMFSDYGYADINRWAYAESKCFGDNWDCGRRAAGAPSPCVDAVAVQDVAEKLQDLFAHNGARSTRVFEEGYLPESPRFSKEKRKTRVLYAGLQAESYNPARFPSFEYSNFYLSLAGMKDVSVLEFPFDPIIGMGRRYWNQKLLDVVRAEKPDVFFAFMLSDEFDPAVLDEIKKTTQSVAWFADDHWRLHNYSHRWAAHFTKIVTTWSRAPEFYARRGITNVLRLQWACNTAAWKPVNAPQDIDVSFVGQYNDARGAIVSDLRARGVPIWVRGFGWPDGRLGSADEVVRTFSKSKINLNFNTPPSRLNPRMLGRILLRRSLNRLVLDRHIIENLKCWWYTGTPQIKARPFEVLGCNAFLISAYADDMDHYYEDGKEIVYYDGTTADLRKKIDKYLGNERERRRIAQAGYAKTMNEHTYEKRFRDIFELLRSHA